MRSTDRPTGIRRRRIDVRVTDDERRQLADAAQARGMAVGTFLRSLGLGDSAPLSDEAEAKRLVNESLARMGGAIDTTLAEVEGALARLQHLDAAASDR